MEYIKGAATDYRVVDAGMTPSVEGAIYVPLENLDSPLPELDRNEKLLLVCSKGKRAYLLQKRLKSLGYANTKVLEGGVSFNRVHV